MAGFVHTANHGQLIITIGATGYTLMDPRWRCMNLGDVRSTTTRGSSLIMPTVAGRKSRRRYTDEIAIPLEMLVRSDAGPSGASVAEADRWTQLNTNTMLLADIAVPPSSNTGYVATYYPPSGATVTANVFVEQFTVTAAREIDGLANRVSFDLIIPAGVWA